MDDQQILDAPEGNGNGPLKIPFKAVVYTIIGMATAYSIFFGMGIDRKFSGILIELWIFKIEVSYLAFLAITSLILYVFTSFVKFELSHWYRVMTVSVTIVLLSIFITLLITKGSFLIGIILILKRVGFVALVVGGGCSLAIQFLLKKHYLIFSAIMICTLVFFSLIDYL